MYFLKALLLLVLGLTAVACTIVTESDPHRDRDDRWEDDNGDRWDNDNDRDGDWSRDNDNSWDRDNDNDRGDWDHDNDRDGDWDDEDDNDRDDDDDNDGRWDNVREDRDDRGGAAWSAADLRAIAPKPREMDRVRGHARALPPAIEELGRILDRDRESLGPDRSWRGEAGLLSLRTAAREFLIQVEANQTRPERTVTAYRRLADSRERLYRYGSRRRLGPAASAQLDRIAAILDAIGSFYDLPPSPARR